MATPLFVYGEVLFDCFSATEQVLGGAPFNVAWHLQAFGVAPVLISRVGQDALGHRVQKAMADWGMDLTGLQVDRERPTGQGTVTLVAGQPSYTLADDQAYDHIAPDLLPAVPAGALLYHGTLALRHPCSRHSLATLGANCTPRIFLDVNLRPPWWQPTTVHSALQAAHWIKLNQDELGQLRPSPGPASPTLTPWLTQPPTTAVILTQGERGAQVETAQGERYGVTPGKRVPVVDTVGAGDGFSSVVLLGLCYGWPWPLILERAQGFAAAVVGLRGATTDDRRFYAPFLRAWHLG